MILAQGSKVLVCHRRLFEDDQPRLFAGVTDAYENGLAKVEGFTWVRDQTHGYVRKDDRRTKIIALASGSVIVYELPREVDIESLFVEECGHQRLLLKDGRKFCMDVSERHVKS